MNPRSPGTCVCPACGFRLIAVERLALAAIRVISAPEPIEPRLIADLDKALAAYLRQSD